MKLTDIELTKNNHFIAMEYYGLILNRTYLVLVVDEYIIGIVANGPVSTQSGVGLAKNITTQLAITEDLNNPFSYVKDRYLKKYQDIDLINDCVKSKHRANFKYKISDISSVIHNPKKKWGMAYYPHDGKVYINVSGRKRELIPLGDQSGEHIKKLLIS